jgi:hypothetical protein
MKFNLPLKQTTRRYLNTRKWSSNSGCVKNTCDTSPSLEPTTSLFGFDHIKATLEKGRAVPATDHIMIPKLGRVKELCIMAPENLGNYNTLTKVWQCIVSKIHA